MVYDDSDAPSWTIEAGGKKFTPLRKACVAPFTSVEKSRIYSDMRIRYPLIREDFDPNGERNQQNRGRSGYRQISWDKALDIVAGEMKRIRETYGPEAVMSRASSHHNWGNLGYRTSTWARFFNLIGFTDILDNPDSWEGWHWGATHTYGFFWRLACRSSTTSWKTPSRIPNSSFTGATTRTRRAAFTAARSVRPVAVLAARPRHKTDRYRSVL